MCSVDAQQQSPDPNTETNFGSRLLTMSIPEKNTRGTCVHCVNNFVCVFNFRFT